MTLRFFLFGFPWWLLLLRSAAAQPASGAASSEPTPWTATRVVGTPDPPLPYRTERVFPALVFKEPAVLTAYPVVDDGRRPKRLVVADVPGRVVTFVPSPDVDSVDVLIDLRSNPKRGVNLYGLAFHPDFRRNRYVYICYVPKNGPDGTRVSRFVATGDDPPRLVRESERIIITWLAGGHNGGCLQFDSAGRLYISTGDGAGPTPPDPLRAGQDVTNLLSSILRIRPTLGDGDPPYTIPADNPFAGGKEARPEIWAYGFRNPWKMYLDPTNDDLWVGDVGWDLWEMIYKVERGGNYGWSIREGRQPIHPDEKRGPTPILPPLIDHPHYESRSITGGRIYRGQRLPELAGAYVYGDFETKKMWAARYADARVVWQREIATTNLAIVAFGEDHAGELLILDYTKGGVHRLVPNEAEGGVSTFPRWLSATGIFSDLRDLTPEAGVLPYTITAAPWEDGATAERHVGLTGDGKIDVSRSRWIPARGGVLVKTLSLELECGRPASRRRVETQLLHFDGEWWQPYTYAWTDAGDDAYLVGANGEERVFELRDPTVAGGVRRQRWRFASRTECLLCHNDIAGPTLGFGAAQLRDAPGGKDGKPLVETWHAALRLRGELPPKGRKPRLLPLGGDAEGADPALRARSYLAVNCGHCHQQNAGGASMVNLSLKVGLSGARLIDAPPLLGSFGIPASRLVVPGAPERSVVLYRMAALGSAHMPRVGTRRMDDFGFRLVWDWIASLPTAAKEGAVVVDVDDQGRSPATMDALATLRRAALAALTDRECSAALDTLLARPDRALLLLHAIVTENWPLALRVSVAQRAVRLGRPEITPLFVRFLSAAERERHFQLPDVAAVLAATGSAARGRDLFFKSATLRCVACHRVQGQGQGVGPDLSVIGRNKDRRTLLESVLTPNAKIEPAYTTYVLLTKTGAAHTGVLVERTLAHVTVRDAAGNVLKVPASDVKSLASVSRSLMPDGLLAGLSAPEVADLLAYLESLR